MPSNEEYKRLRRLIIFFGTLSFILLLIFATIGTLKIKDLNRVIIAQQNGIDKLEGKIPNVHNGDRGEIGLQGPQGLQGAQGVQGIQGSNGQNGQNGTNGVQGPQGVQGIQGEKGDKGDQGDVGPQGPAGKDGRTLYVNPITGECRYAGDEAWQPASECP